MLHARADHQSRIHDSAGLIPADEPVFFIRGQDRAAIPAAEAWCVEAERLGADPAVVAAVRKHIEKVRDWQTKHGSKVPDMPSSLA
jgi:hypothetical protein